METLSPIQRLCNLLQVQMNLDTDHCYVFDQKFIIPKDPGLVLVISLLSSKPFGMSKDHAVDAATGALVEVQGQNVQELYQVEVFSRGKEALIRLHEPAFVLASDAAQSLCEQYAFSISTLPTTFVNISTQDGTAIPYRFASTFQLTRFEERRTLVPYFDQFENPPSTILIEA